MSFNSLTLNEKKERFESLGEYKNNNSNYNINVSFLVANGTEDCEREQMVSLYPMTPMLEKVNRVTVEEADYILYAHPIARSEDFTDDAINDINIIMSRKKKNAEVIIMGKACNVKDYINEDENITYVKSHYTKYLGDRFGFDIEDQYFVYNEDDQFYVGYDDDGKEVKDNSTLSIWPVDGCNNKCGFCRRCFMHIEYESLPLEYLKEKLDWYKENEPYKMKKIALRAENLTQYGIDLYGKPMLEEVIKLVDSYEELESINFHIGLNIGEITKEMASAMADCKRIDSMSLNIEAGTDRLIKLIGKNHTIQKAASLCYLISRAHPNIHLDSTVMIGLPTETIEDIRSLAYAIEYCGFNHVLVNHYQYSDKHALASYEQLDKKIVALHNKYLLKYLREIHNNGKILIVEYEDEYKSTRKDFRLKKLLEEASKYVMGKYHKAGKMIFFGKNLVLRKNYSWTDAEYNENIHKKINELQQLKQPIKDKIQKLKTGDFSEVNIDKWFQNLNLNYIFAAIEGCNKTMNFQILNFISIYAQHLLANPDTKGLEDVIFNEYMEMGVLPGDVDRMPFSEFLEYRNRRTIELCEQILDQVINVGIKHYSYYRYILEQLFTNENDNVYSYCSSNSDYSKYLEKVSQKENANQESYNIYDNTDGYDLEKQRIHFLETALENNVIECYEEYVNYPRIGKAYVTFKSLLFKEVIRKVELDKDVFCDATSGRKLAAALNKILKAEYEAYKEDMFPDCFKEIKNPVMQMTNNQN